ncbi:DUF2191 domain-containing protein [Leptolyngbya sp. BC1307]|uniref:DUF2191 domain-containing protein n=1 Tax=Leptolyngbya sp. BC1307 TaxID=2029589 RepID=UPI000EFB9B9B|nr:DUF2191 domain-containing protein [Leptolyngbya sp. BC1307]
MRTTIRLNDELLQTAKQHALATQRTLTQLIQDALVSLLEKERSAASPRTVELPTFKGDGTYPGIDINSNASLRDCMELSE